MIDHETQVPEPKKQADRLDTSPATDVSYSTDVVPRLWQYPQHGKWQVEVRE